MSHFECHFNRCWRSKKVVQVVQIRGGGGGEEVIWTKSKRTAAFFRVVTPSLISSDLWIGNFISIFTCSNGQFGLSGFGHINQRPAEKPRSRGSYAPALTPRIRSVFVRRTNRLLLSLDEFLFWHPSIFSTKPSVQWVCQSFCFWYFLISAILVGEILLSTR